LKKTGSQILMRTLKSPMVRREIKMKRFTAGVPVKDLLSWQNQRSKYRYENAVLLDGNRKGIKGSIVLKAVLQNRKKRK